MFALIDARKKSKGKAKTNNPKTLATFEIQDTGQRQTKQKRKQSTTNKTKNTDPGVRE